MNYQDLIVDLKTLRAKTGRSLKDCKKALEATESVTKAIAWLEAQGAINAEKKTDREAAEGVIHSYVHANRIGVLVEIKCETDFAARSDIFKEFAELLSLQIASMNPATVSVLIEQESIFDSTKTIKQLWSDLVSKLGENVIINRFVRWELGDW